MNNFSIIEYDRLNRLGGGVGLHIKTTLIIQLIYDILIQHVCSTELLQPYILLVSIYRHPKCRTDKFGLMLNIAEKPIDSLSAPLMLLCDFNLIGHILVVTIHRLI